MQLEQLQRWLEWSGNFILFELLLLCFLFWFNGHYKNYDSINALFYCYLLSFLVAFGDVLFIVYFFTKSFPYRDSHLLPLLSYLKITNLTFLSPFSYLVKFIFFGLFFKSVLADIRIKKTFHYLIILLVIFEVVQVFVFKSYSYYDSLSSTVKNLFLISGTAIFLYRFYNNDRITTRLQRNPYFWISLSLLLPALADIFLEFIFQKLHATDMEGFFKLYLVRNANNAVGLFFMMIAVRYFKNLRFLPKEY